MNLLISFAESIGEVGDSCAIFLTSYGDMRSYISELSEHFSEGT